MELGQVTKDKGTLERWSALVVDDDPTVSKHFTKLLRRYQANVECTGSADRAYQLIGRMQPIVALVDLGLADDGCGFRLIERLRTDHDTRKTAVVIVTGRGPEEVADRAASLSVEVHYKETRSELLLGKIRDAILFQHVGRGRLGTTATRAAKEAALTPLQAWYLTRILDGRSYAEMATEQVVSEPTAKMHVQRILTYFRDSNLFRNERLKDQRALRTWFLYEIGRDA